MLFEDFKLEKIFSSAEKNIFKLRKKLFLSKNFSNFLSKKL